MNRIREALARLGGYDAARTVIKQQMSYEMCDGGIYDEVGALALYAIDVLEKPMFKHTPQTADKQLVGVNPGAILVPTGSIEMLRCQNCDQLVEAARNVTKHQDQTTMGVGVPAERDYTNYHRVPVADMLKLVDAIDRSADEEPR